MDLDVMRLNSREEFQTWLAKEVEVRDELEAVIGSELGLDDSSIDKLEDFLLKRYKSPSDALKLNERNVLDAVARHIGLVMLLNVHGSQWAIDLENEDNVYYRLPIIRMSDEAEECPLAMATASLDRRRGNYLHGVIENYEEIYNTSTEKKE